MGENSKISWTHHTFNPWWGCVEVSDECDFCYARDFAHRLGREIWGKGSPRLFFGESHWNEPLKWNLKALQSGERQRVFCASMSDVLEEWDGRVLFSGKGSEEYWILRRHGKMLDEARLRVWELIEATPYLDWLLLTKRPQNFAKMLPATWIREPRPNVWAMTTVGLPDTEWRINGLLAVPAAVRGISWEPALGYVNFKKYPGVSWVIGGGESGARHRPIDLDVIRRVRDDCYGSGIAFFLKQLGGWPDKRDRMDEWPEDLRVQQFPTPNLMVSHV